MQILNNPDVLNLSLQSLKNYFTQFYVASYQPLASLSFGLEYYFFGNNPLIPHISNLVLHIINIILVYYILDRVLSVKNFLKYFVVAVFAFHPYQAPLIGWISTRSTLLYSLFFLLSMLSYLKYLRSNQVEKRYLIFSFLFFVFSLFSKASAVVLPVVLILLDYLYNRKFSFRLFFEKIPFFMGSFIFGILSILSRKVLETNDSFLNYYSIYERLSIFSHSIFLYLKKCFVATDFLFFYSYPYRVNEGSSIGLSFLISPLWLLIIIGLIFYLFKKLTQKNKRTFLFGILFFLVNIFLVLSFRTTFSPTFFQERYMYIPIIGVFMSVVILINSFIKNKPYVGKVIKVILLFFLIFISFQSRERSYFLQTDKSLWTYVEKTGSQSRTPNKKLGRIYAREGRHKKAIDIYNNGIKINPLSVELYYWRGISIAEIGDLNYALTDFNRVIAAKSKDLIGKAYYQKSVVFKKLSLLDSSRIALDSAAVYNNTEGLFNNNNTPLNKLADIKNKLTSSIDSLIKINKIDEAIAIYDNLLLIFPNDISNHFKKGFLETQSKKWEASAKTFTKILKLNTKNENARLSRAYSYFSIKKYPESIADYSFVIDSLKTKNGEVFYFRALSYLNNNQKGKACLDLEEALKLGYLGDAQNLKNKLCN